MTTQEMYERLNARNKEAVNQRIAALLAQQKESSSQCGHTEGSRKEGSS